MPTHGRRCASCKKPYEATYMQKQFLGVSARGDDGKLIESDDEQCPFCGSTEHTAMVFPVATFRVAGYPYYDRGAGQTFSSARERDQWMKDNNKVAMDGGLESQVETHLQDIHRERDEHDRVYADMLGHALDDETVRKDVGEGRLTLERHEKVKP